MTDNRPRKTHKVEDLGDGISLWSDGAKRAADGKLIERHPLATPFTSERITSIQLHRHEQAREKAAEGLLRAVQANEPGTYGAPPDAWGKVVEKQTELAIAIDAGRDSTQAAKFVGHASGMLADRGQAAAADQRTFVLNISDDIVREMRQLSAGGGDVIEGELLDLDDNTDWDTDMSGSDDGDDESE